MDAYLNAGFGEPIPDGDFEFMRSAGVGGIRAGVPNGMPKDEIMLLVGNMSRSGTRVHWVVGGWEHWTGVSDQHGRRFVSDRDRTPDVGAIIASAMDAAKFSEEMGLEFTMGFGNEPNQAPPAWRSAEAYIVAMRAVIGVVNKHHPHVRWYAGEVSNLSESDGLPYLERVARHLPDGVGLSLHPYRRERAWDDQGGSSMEELAGHVAGLADGFAITEGGWHGADYHLRRGFPLCWTRRTVRYSEEDIAAFATYELDLWDSVGADFYVWYQLNDGPNRERPDDNFGVRRLDGSEKPIVDVFRRFKSRRES